MSQFPQGGILDRDLSLPSLSRVSRVSQFPEAGTLKPAARLKSNLPRLTIVSVIYLQDTGIEKCDGRRTLGGGPHSDEIKSNWLVLLTLSIAEQVTRADRPRMPGPSSRSASLTIARINSEAGRTRSINPAASPTQTATLSGSPAARTLGMLGIQGLGLLALSSSSRLAQLSVKALRNTRPVMNSSGHV